MLWYHRAQGCQWVFPLPLLIISAALHWRISYLNLKASHKQMGVPIQTQGRTAGWTSFFSFLFFFFLILIFVPQPGIGPTLAALEAQSLNHWTAREVPKLLSRNWQWLARVVRKGKIHVCGYHWICRQAMECKYLVTENWLPGADGVSVWLSRGPFCTSHVYMGPLFPSKQRVRGLAPLLLTELLERNVSF